jgi:GH43 family beta-xylosidase
MKITPRVGILSFLLLLLLAVLSRSNQVGACAGDTGGAHLTGASLIVPWNFPDPFFLNVNGAYYGFATGQNNIQVLSPQSRKVLLAFEQLPDWVRPVDPQFWAPEVVRTGSGFLLYYNARHKVERREEISGTNNRQCIGVGFASKPEGPYTDSGLPLVCAFAEGAIDASPFYDGGQSYLYFKRDGNCCSNGSAATIYAQRLENGGMKTSGRPIALLSANDSFSNEDDWEGSIVEAPTMIVHDGKYYLFYSGNWYNRREYAVGYLNCAGPLGPCRDPGTNPVLNSSKWKDLYGPGHQSVMTEDRLTYISFHAWNADPRGREDSSPLKRCAYTSQLQWRNGIPLIDELGFERPRGLRPLRSSSNSHD